MILSAHTCTHMFSLWGSFIHCSKVLMTHQYLLPLSSYTYVKLLYVCPSTL